MIYCDCCWLAFLFSRYKFVKLVVLVNRLTTEKSVAVKMEDDEQ